ncbi:hypothetical protein, partial [Salmonella sp. gx-f7]|uniref:hypothetical protein n=1 Tax=Salmonella sp. gx-f7 TaxID=2582606 RepID=UPI001F32CA40
NLVDFHLNAHFFKKKKISPSSERSTETFSPHVEVVVLDTCQHYQLVFILQTEGLTGSGEQ